MHLIRSVRRRFFICYNRYLDLEFDKESGALKKTKFVSEADVI